MHAQKYNRAAVGHVLAHNEPTKARKARDNVDSSKTEQNYNLSKMRGLTGVEKLRRILSREEVHCSPRSDVNTLCSWVVSAPKNLPPEREKEFFLSVAQFFSKRYEPSRCVSAWVHHDEPGRVHMHYDFCPLVVDEKRGGLKVCAKDVLTRKDLATIHKDLRDHISRVMGLNLDIINGATAHGNKSIIELKNKSLEAENERLMRINSNLRAQICRALER